MNLFTGRLFFLAFVISLFSCNIINPVEPIPSYIKISSYEFVNTPNLNTGSLSNKITDAWVYIDNDPVGVFELPFTIPVLKEGLHSIKIRPGIMQNGIASTRIEYPFYADYDTTINFAAEETHTIFPVFAYKSNTKFSLLEDFEGSGLKLETSNASDTTLKHIKNNPIVFEGTGCGAGFLDDENILFEIVSSENLSLPKNSPVYLELNYRNETDFSCGVYANEPGQTNQYSSGLSINPSENWNKIYVDMGLAIGSSLNASNYKLYIGALKTPDGTVKSIYLDNVKLVHW